MTAAILVLISAPQNTPFCITMASHQVFKSLESQNRVDRNVVLVSKSGPRSKRSSARWQPDLHAVSTLQISRLTHVTDFLLLLLFLD